MIQENIANIRSLISKVNNSPMCGIFEESDTHYTVHFPAGFFPQAARAEKGGNKSLALRRLVSVMNRVWDESYPGKKNKPQRSRE
jgi:hypothetical protein